MRFTSILRTIAILSVAACVDPYASTPTPDYAIRVTHSANGTTALPPSCPSWVTNKTDPYDNQPIPQFGCANARNLAIMADRPTDLIKGRDSGSPDATVSVNSIKNYQGGYSRGLIDPGADASQVAITTAPSSTSSSSSSSSSSSGSSSTSTSSGP